MYVLGIHKDPWHDTGAAIVRYSEGKADYFMITEERLNREKDSRKFPRKAIASCLEHFNLKSINDVDHIAIDFIKNKDIWKDFIGNLQCELDAELLLNKSKIHVINHHLCHAAAAFYSSGFERSAVLIVDGRGSDHETQSLFIGDEGGVRLISSTKKIGIGLLYTAVTRAIGFGAFQEGKTMGLAPYGELVEGNIFNFRSNFKEIETDYSLSVRQGQHVLIDSHQDLISFDLKSRAAYEVQVECEKAMIHLANYARQTTGLDHLCISGGVALNSVANYKILKSNIFKDVYVNPAASDTGIPLGAAMHLLHGVLEQRVPVSRVSPYLGPIYSREKYVEAIGRHVGFTVLNDGLATAVKMLSENKIVANHYGRSEIGPRALGNRSIMMSPLLASNKDTLNTRVKHRESFRPFAPVTLDEHVSDFFEMDRSCPYMLFVPKVREQKRSVIPAVTHVDGSGRLQSVNRIENPIFFDIVNEFGRLTGVPVILNTSFNDNGEPIVETPDDAIRCFLGTNIDALLLDGDILLIKNT